MLTVPPTDELTLANRAELVRWDAYNKQLYSVLFLFTKRASNSFLVRFAGRPNSRQQPDGQAAWKAMGEKYLNSSMQRRRILMHKLNGMTMRPNRDPDEHLTAFFQQRDELEHIGESFAEARILDIILEGLSDEYEPIRFAAEWDQEISLKEIEITMRNLNANCVARGDGSTFLREKGRQSDMTVSSGFKGSCDCCSKPGHIQAQCFIFLRESGGGPLPSSGAERGSWCSLHNTHLHDNAECRAQQQQRGNSNGSGYNRGNDSDSGNRRRHGDDSNTGRANTVVIANGTSSPSVIAPTPAAPVVTAPSSPVAAPPTPLTAPPTPVRSEAAPTPYVNESPPSGIGFSVLAGSATPSPLQFTMTSDCGA